MARLFNGTSDTASLSVDLSPYSVVTIHCRCWITSGSDPNAYMVTHASAATGGLRVLPNFGSATTVLVAVDDTVNNWQDHFPAPTKNAWHDYLLVFDRATPQNLVWVDGVAQTLTTQNHDAGSYGNFANATFAVMKNVGSSLFQAGRMAELAIWGGVILTIAEAKALAAGANPVQVHPDNLVLYAPMYGHDSPEPDYSGKQRSLALTGTSFVAHPGVRPWMLPPLSYIPGRVSKNTAAVSGATTPTGGLAKAAAKPSLAGSVTPAGTAARQTGKPVGGSVAPSGAVVRACARAFGGATTPVGVAVRAVAKLLAGSSSPTGLLTRQAEKPGLSGSVTPAGTAVRLCGKVLSGVITPVGTAVRACAKRLSGSSTPTGALTRAAGRVFGGSSTPTGAVTKAAAKPLAGATTPTGTLAKQADKTVGGSSTPSGALVRLCGKALSGFIAPAGTVGRATARRFAGAVTPSGGLAKRIAKAFAGAIAPFGAVVTLVTGKPVLGRFDRGPAADDDFDGYTSPTARTLRPK